MGIHKPIRELTVSEFEREAKHAAVEAVETRWKKQNRLKRLAAFRAALRNVSAIGLLLALCGGGAYWYMTGGGSVRQAVEQAYASVSSEKQTASGGSPLVPAPLVDSKPEVPLAKKASEAIAVKQDPALAYRNRYAGLISVFRAKPLGSWKSAPASIRPKNAQAGTVYHALVARQPAGYDIYEIVIGAQGKMEYSLLSPIAEAVSVTSADFKAACAAGYLIESDGAVYVCGKATDDAVKKLQERLGTVGGGDGK